MAQPNVVREPSMDEILASIRRIIESNDPVPSGVANAMPEPEGFNGSAANDDMEDVPLTIDDSFASLSDADHGAADAHMPHHQFRVESVAESYAAASHDAEPVQQAKSLSLADVAARVRAASERNPGLRELAPKVREEAPVAVALARAVETLEPMAVNPVMTSRMAAAPAPQPERAAVDWNELPSRAQASEASFERAVPAQAEAPAASDVEQEAPVAASLISVDAGQQVARSFQDLAVAIDEAERRSYEEIASDLLRPMLQEWLDENLPTLVERLVREEIERVARGSGNRR